MGLKAAALGLAAAGTRFAYGLFRLVRRPSDRVVFISRQRDNIPENFRILSEEIRKLDPAVSAEFSCRLGLKSSMGLSYVPLLLRQLWMLAGARACVTESYCPAISLPENHGSTRIIQIWHSMVAIKRFGWQTVGLSEGSDPVTAKAMRMHAGYTAVVCGSEFQRRFFAEAMNVPTEKIYPLGSPEAPELIKLAENRDQAERLREELLKRYPQAAGKRLIAYLPTMRRGRAVPFEGLIEHAGDSGGDSYIFIGLHPLDSFTRGCPGFAELSAGGEYAAADCGFSSRQLMTACGAVISDYSGAAAEAALLGRELYFYVPDLEEYSGECGLNTDPAELFPEITARTGEEMARLLSAPYPEGCGSRARELLAGGCTAQSAERIARLVLGEYPED